MARPRSPAQDPFFAALEQKDDEYRAIETPALIIAGEEDRCIPANVQKKLAAILPNSRFEMIPDSGHVVYLEQPEAFFGTFKAFMNRKSTG